MTQDEAQRVAEMILAGKAEIRHPGSTAHGALWVVKDAHALLDRLAAQVLALANRGPKEF